MTRTWGSDWRSFFQNPQTVDIPETVVEEHQVDAGAEPGESLLSASADSASMTPYPSDERRSTRDQRINCSSSTTRMVAFDMPYGIMAPLSTNRAAQLPVA